MTQNCKKCLNFFKFAEEVDEKKNGFCRKEAPSAIAQALVGYAFPRMNENEWCQDFSDITETELEVFRGIK